MLVIGQVLLLKRSAELIILKAKVKDREGIDIIDLPGIYSLSPYTP
jgi:hypothetical protein